MRAEHQLAGHVEVDDDVDRPLDGDLVERLGLGDGAREAVEDVAPVSASSRRRRSSTMPIMISSPTRPPASMTSLAIEPELGALAHGGAQHVAGGDVRHDEVARQADALRALAGALPAEDDEPRARDQRAPPVRRGRLTSGSLRSCAASAGCRSGASARGRRRRRSARVVPANGKFCTSTTHSEEVRQDGDDGDEHGARAA